MDMTILRNALLSLLLCAGCALAAETDDGDRKTRANDEIVSVTAVPDTVLSSAKQALPGAYFTKVTRQHRRDDRLYFRFDASQVGRYWVLLVRDDGEILEKYETSSAPPLGRNS
jgi:hypothetical protein